MIKKYKVRFMIYAFRVYYTHQENGLEVVICSCDSEENANHISQTLNEKELRDQYLREINT